MNSQQNPHTRPVYQAVAAYAVAAWVAYQVVLALYDGLGLPEWLPRYSLILLLIGLPMVAATAFVQHRIAAARMSRDDGSIVVRSLTWRRTWLGGAAAFVVLAIITTGVAVAKRRNTLFAQGVIERDARIVLADFSSGDAKDSLTAVAMTESIRSTLLDSRVVHLATTPEVTAGLERMKRRAADGLPLSVATELAQRENYQAVIAGSIIPVGTGYVLTIDVLGPDSASYARVTATVDNSSALISGFKKISAALREKVGESVKTVRASVPLSMATTSSMPALRKYSEAVRIENTTNDGLAEARLLREAVAIDSVFPEAWRKLSVMYENLGVRRTAAREALLRAYSMRDQLPEFERAMLMFSYSAYILNDRIGAVDALREVVEKDSTKSVGYNNVGVALLWQERYSEALPYLSRAAQMGNGLAASNYAVALYQVDAPNAMSAIDSLRKRFPDNEVMTARYAGMLASNGDWYRSHLILDSLATKGQFKPTSLVPALRVLASSAFVQGRFAEGHEITMRADRNAASLGLPDEQRKLALNEALAILLITGDTTAARSRIAASLAAVPDSVLPRGDRDYAVLSLMYAMLRDTQRATSLAGEAEATYAPPLDLAQAHAFIAMQRRDIGGVIAAAAEAQRSPVCSGCSDVLRGEGFYSIGQMDSARAAYDRYFTRRDARRLDRMPLFHVTALLRDAELNAAAGNRAVAAARYQQLLKLWSHADASMQPRIQAVRDKLRALQGAG